MTAPAAGPAVDVGTRFGVACSTLGLKLPQLCRLVDSVPPHIPVGICYQGPSVPTPLAQLAARRGNVAIVQQGGGASAGRNAAVAALTARHALDVLLFPNDDSVYPARFFDDLAAVWRDCRPVQVLALPVLRQGDEGVWIPRPGLDPLCLLDPDRASRLLRGSHEPGLVVERSAFVDAGGFDVDLGPGSGTRWQSGEGPDLAFRIRRRGGALRGSRYPTVLENRPAEIPPEWRRKWRLYLPGVVYVCVRSFGILRAARVFLGFLWSCLFRYQSPASVVAATGALVAGVRYRLSGRGATAAPLVPHSQKGQDHHPVPRP